MDDQCNSKFAYMRRSDNGPVAAVLGVHFTDAADPQERAKMLENLKKVYGAGMLFDASVSDEEAKTEIESGYCYILRREQDPNDDDSSYQQNQESPALLQLAA